MADHLAGGLHCSDVEDLAASFVLGALEPADAAAVRDHLAGCPELHPEFAELGSVVPALLASVEPVEPPAGLGARIRAAAADVAGSPTAPVSAPRPVAPPARAAGSRWWNRISAPVWAGVAIAAAIAVVALGAWNLALQSEIDGLAAYRDGVVAVLDEAAQPGAQLAVLASPEGGIGATGIAAVAADGAVSMVLRDLAPTAGGQVYEAWLIAGTGDPVPIGGFTVPASGTASFTTTHASLGDGVTVALTLEPGPGATTPTLPIIALGAARAAS